MTVRQVLAGRPQDREWLLWEEELEDFEPAPLPINLVHVEGRRVPAKIRCFLDLARDRLRAVAVLN